MQLGSGHQQRLGLRRDLARRVSVTVDGRRDEQPEGHGR